MRYLSLTWVIICIFSSYTLYGVPLLTLRRPKCLKLYQCHYGHIPYQFPINHGFFLWMANGPKSILRKLSCFMKDCRIVVSENLEISLKNCSPSMVIKIFVVIFIHINFWLIVYFQIILLYQIFVVLNLNSKPKCILLLGIALLAFFK